MNGVAGVKEHPRGDGECHRRKETDAPRDKPPVLEQQPDVEGVDEHQGEAHHGHAAPKKRLREVQDVEMERPVVIAGIVLEIAQLRHLVDEPTVHAFVKVRRLHPEPKEAEKEGERDDKPCEQTRRLHRGGEMGLDGGVLARHFGVLQGIYLAQSSFSFRPKNYGRTLAGAAFAAAAIMTSITLRTWVFGTQHALICWAEYSPRSHFLRPWSRAAT